MKRFVIGDIHGRFEALKQVLDRSKFDYNNDKLIVLGDIVDGGYDTFLVVEELLKIKNLIFVLGNHDSWFINHIKTGWSNDIWLNQGGKNTITSYKEHSNLLLPVTHQEFFNKAVYYHIEDNNKLFVHGGIDPHTHISQQDKHTLLWDRELIQKIKNGAKTDFEKIYIGHTSTQSIKSDINFTKLLIISIPTTKLYCMDTGAGWNGKLSILDIDIDICWQSDLQTPAINERAPVKNICACGTPLNNSGQYSIKCRACQLKQDKLTYEKNKLEKLANHRCKVCNTKLDSLAKTYCASCAEEKHRQGVYKIAHAQSELKKIRTERLKAMSPQELLDLVKGNQDNIW